MSAFEFEPNDEVFHLKNHHIGLVLNVKETDHPAGKKFVRVQIKPDQPDQIWPVEEVGLWIRNKRFL
ncbi:MAG TPA: hypothetical protein VMU88_01515 [bacterium]|nr:hypothetical protein [bacterium]